VATRSVVLYGARQIFKRGVGRKRRSGQGPLGGVRERPATHERYRRRQMALTWQTRTFLFSSYYLLILPFPLWCLCSSVFPSYYVTCYLFVLFFLSIPAFCCGYLGSCAFFFPAPATRSGGYFDRSPASGSLPCVAIIGVPAGQVPPRSELFARGAGEVRPGPRCRHGPLPRSCRATKRPGQGGEVRRAGGLIDRMALPGRASRSPPRSRSRRKRDPNAGVYRRSPETVAPTISPATFRALGATRFDLK